MGRAVLHCGSVYKALLRVLMINVQDDSRHSKKMELFPTLSRNNGVLVLLLSQGSQATISSHNAREKYARIVVKMVEGAVRIYSVVLRWKLNFHPLACLSSTRSIVLFDKVKYKKMLEKFVRQSNGPSRVVESDIHESVGVRIGAFRFVSLGKIDNVSKGTAITECNGDGKGKYAELHVDNSAQTCGKQKDVAIEGKTASFVKMWGNEPAPKRVAREPSRKVSFKQTPETIVPSSIRRRVYVYAR
ncbi:hypothetical protein LguiB_021362 [Lonicera macranthoides]